MECPECAGRVIKDGSEYYCEDCGLVVRDEPLVATGSSRGSREIILSDTHHPPEDSMEFDIEVPDNLGTTITDNTLRKLVPHVSDSKKKSIDKGYDLIKRYSHALDLPACVRKDAYILFVKAVNNNMLRGRHIKSIVPACLYRACLENNVARPLSIFEDFIPKNNQNIGKTYRVLMDYLDLPTIIIELEDTIDYLNLKPKIRSELLDIIENKKHDLVKEIGINSWSIIGALSFLLGADIKMISQRIDQRPDTIRINARKIKKAKILEGD